MSDTHEKNLTEWRATLSDREKAIVDALPPACPTDRTGSAEDAATWSSLSYEVNMDGMDTLGEQLAERFNITIDQGEAMAAFIAESNTLAAQKAHAEVLGVVIGEFLGARPTDAAVVFWALAFASGLAKRLTDATPATKARELGVTKSLVSSWQSRWQARFSFHDITFSKTPEAKHRMSVAAKGRHRKKL